MFYKEIIKPAVSVIVSNISELIWVFYLKVQPEGQLAYYLSTSDFTGGSHYTGN